MTVVAGADGAREGGWVLVRLRDGRLERMVFAADFTTLLEESREAELVLVDVPLGHEGGAARGRRAADEVARTFLGPERGRSVFDVPPPEVLAIPEHEAACAVAAERGWAKPSRQLWGIRERILRAQRFAAQEGERVREGHPEVSFQALAAQLGRIGHLEHAKKGWHGLHERIVLLEEARLRPQRLMGGVGLVSPDDVLDATVLAWSAARIAQGDGSCLPTVPPMDPEGGRRVAIWY